jgi:hypothetical protein
MLTFVVHEPAACRPERANDSSAGTSVAVGGHHSSEVADFRRTAFALFRQLISRPRSGLRE